MHSVSVYVFDKLTTVYKPYMVTYGTCVYQVLPLKPNLKVYGRYGVLRT